MEKQFARMNQMQHILTKRMTHVVSSLNERFVNLYCRDDFKNKISYLKVCKSDEKGSVSKKIVDMFHACKISDVDFYQSPEYYQDILDRSNICDRNDLSQYAYESLLAEFCEHPYPSPEEYIERIVNTAIVSDWGNDTLRIKILKKFLSDANGLESAGYKALFVRQYASAKKGKKVGSNREAVNYVDDDIFADLPTATKQQLRKNGKFGLLKICDDLASGRFGNSNVVREEIYLFAIVFDLIFFADDEEGIKRPELKNLDIERVMFNDYYSNNLMRYVSGQHKYIRSGGEEKNPSGKGINYKNYMEVIFLYFLIREDLSIQEKIDSVYRFADQVHKEYMSEKREKRNKQFYTSFYSSTFKDYALETEEEFKKLLLEMFDCSVQPNKTTVFSVETEQNTAVEAFQKLLDDADEIGVLEENYSHSSHIREGLNDNVSKKKIAFWGTEEEINEAVSLIRCLEKNHQQPMDLDKESQFKILLYQVNCDLQDDRRKEVIESKIVSRADMLRVFYQYYLILNSENKRSRSFPEVYSDFTYYANQRLSDALLSPIDGRNLYDLILIYSAYVEANL